MAVICVINDAVAPAVGFFPLKPEAEEEEEEKRNIITQNYPFFVVFVCNDLNFFGFGISFFGLSDEEMPLNQHNDADMCSEIRDFPIVTEPIQIWILTFTMKEWAFSWIRHLCMTHGKKPISILALILHWIQLFHVDSVLWHTRTFLAAIYEWPNEMNEWKNWMAE